MKLKQNTSPVRAQSEQQHKSIRKVLRRWQLYLLIFPAMVYLILFCYKPMYGVIIAFKDYSFKMGIWDSPWVGLDNFTRLFTTYTFPIALKNTLTLSILSLILGFPIPIILALSANEIRNGKLKKTLQTVSYAPHFISVTVMCGMLILFLSPSSGIINQFIKMLGGSPVAFMQEPQLFKWVYVLSGIWQGAGWGAVIYFAALSGVDQSLLDSASIDGASRFQKIIYINFPVLVPTIMIMLVLRCGQILSVGYEKVLLLQNSANISASEILSTYVYKVGLQNFDYSFSTAAGLFNSVCNTIVLIVANTISKAMTKSSLW